MAVLSRGLASVAADGLRTTPARDTDTTAVFEVLVAVASVEGAGVIVLAEALDEDAGTDAGLETGAGAEAALPPKVKSSCPDVFLGSQAVWSSCPLLTVMQTALLPFCGTNGAGPAPPLNAKSCELVTDPPPSARPPHEKRRT